MVINNNSKILYSKTWRTPFDANINKINIFVKLFSIKRKREIQGFGHSLKLSQLSLYKYLNIR